MTRLTNRRLEAMETALSSMIAGYCEDEMGDWGDTSLEDLEAASDWVAEQRRKREQRRKKA